MKRKTIIIIAAVIGCVVLLLVLVPLLIDADTFRPTIQARLSSGLGRQVQIGHLHASLLSGGFSAEDVSIADDSAFSHAPFLHAKSLDVGVELIPLIFSHALRVQSLEVKEPDLTFLRSPAGKWNFASLGAKTGSRDDSSSAPGEFSVQKLKIAKGRVTFGRTASSARQVWEDVSLEAKNVSYTTAIPVTFEAKSPSGGTLALEGTAGPMESGANPGSSASAASFEHLPIQMKLHIKKLPAQDVQGLLQILGIVLPSGSSLQGGTMNADLGLDGPFERLVTAGPVSVSNVHFSGFNLGSKLASMAALTGAGASSETFIQSMSSKLRVAPEGIRAEEISVNIPALGTLTGAGTVGNDNRLNFRMVAKLNGGANALSGIANLTRLGQATNGNGLSFRIQGTTSSPVFIPDFAGAMGNIPTSPNQGLGNLLGGILGKKKP
jgi:hypothetical protein